MEKVEESVAFYTDQRSRMIKLWYLRRDKYEDPAKAAKRRRMLDELTAEAATAGAYD